MSSSFIYSVGLNNVGSYQASGMPFLTSSALPASGANNYYQIDFPYTTKSITVVNHGGTGQHCRIAFSRRGLHDTVANYVSIDGFDKIEMDVKAQSIFLMADGSYTPNFSVYASLTNIDVGRVEGASPSGSNWSGSIGVG
jgi:hypothetical protein